MLQQTFINIALPTFTALVGFFLGNFLAVGRDKRKEFNEVAIAISLKFMKQIEIFEKGGFVDNFVSNDDFRELGLHFKKRTSTKYAVDLTEYRKSIERSGHYAAGGWHIDDLSTYIKASHKMLSYAKKK